MEWSDRGVILRAGPFHEADMWLKILFRERGILTAFAFGAAKSKVRFCGCLDVFNSIEGKAKTSRGDRYVNLQEASLLAAPRRLRSDWRSMGAAANCLRFLEAAGVDAGSAPQFFDLLEDLRAWLEAASAPPALAPHFFRLRVAGLMGYAPDFRRCARCGAEAETGAVFQVEEGVALCARCRPTGSISPREISLTAPVLRNLRAAQFSPPAKWSSEPMSPFETRACSRLIDNFVEYHIGLKWGDGFYRRV